MNSQFSGGECESGWTMYFDQSSLYRGGGGLYLRNEEEEDLSMVSDASSGPPLCCEDDEGSFDRFAKKTKDKKKSREQKFSFLDDTASSSVLGKKVIENEFSRENDQHSSPTSSAAHLKGKSSLKNIGFFRSSGKSSLKERSKR